MIEQTRDDGDAATRKLEERNEFNSYVWGIALALVLTLVPFALVHWVAMPSLSLLSVIGAFALVQMVVHWWCVKRIAQVCELSKIQRVRLQIPDLDAFMAFRFGYRSTRSVGIRGRAWNTRFLITESPIWIQLECRKPSKHPSENRADTRGIFRNCA